MTPTASRSARFAGAILPFLFHTGLAWAQTAPPSVPSETVKGDWRSLQVTEPSGRVRCQTRTVMMDLPGAAGTPATPVAGELTLSFYKDAKTLPKIQLRLPAQNEKPNVILVKLSSKDSHLMFLDTAAAEAASVDTYQSAPQQLSTLLDVIRGQNTLSIFLDAKAPTPTLLRVSLKGSSASLDQMATCTGRSSLLPTEFLKGLNTAVDLSNVQLSEKSIRALLAATDAAYTASLSAGEDNAALATLRKQFAKLLADEKNAQDAYNRAQKNTDDLLAALEARQQKLTALREELAQLQAARPGAVTNIDNLKTIEAQKLAAYEPIRQQLIPFDNEVNRQEGRVDDARTDLSNARQDVASSQQHLSNLRSRQSSARSELSSADFRRRSLESDLDRAEWDVRRFDVERERRDYLDRSFQYRNAINQRNNAQSGLGGAQSSLSSAQSTLSSLQSQLATCRATAGADCSALDSQVNNQQNVVNQAAAQVQNLQWQINSANQTIQNEERQAEWQARSRYQDLQRKRDEIARDLQNTRRNISDLQTEIRQIDFEIPRTETDIRNAESRVRSAQGYLRDAQAQLETAIQKRADMRKQLDWERLRSEYLTSKSDREKAVSDLAKADARAKDLPFLIKDQESSVASAQKRYDASLPPTAQALAKLNAITTQLTAFRQQEADLVQKIATAKQNFDLNRALYQSLYNSLKVL